MNSYIDMAEYDGVPDYRRNNPECPVCGTEMGYSYYRSEFKCPSCGYTAGEYELDFEDNDTEDIPYGCAACGGPWPDCIIGCDIYED